MQVEVDGLRAELERLRSQVQRLQADVSAVRRVAEDARRLATEDAQALEWLSTRQIELRRDVDDCRARVATG